MKSYDQTERRFDRKASFSVKLQEAESVNNFVKTETNMKNKEQHQLKAFLTREVISLAEVNDGVFLAGIMGEEIAIRPEEDTIYVPVILQGSIQFFDYWIFMELYFIVLGLWIDQQSASPLRVRYD